MNDTDQSPDVAHPLPARALRVARLWALPLLAAGLIGVAWLGLDQVVWVWDDGNTYYAATAWHAGHTPNVDFRNGYPGLMAWGTACWIGVAGSGMRAVALPGLLAALVSAACAAWVYGRRWNGFAAAAAFGLVLCAGWFTWPNPNPGYGMEAAMAAGAICCWLGFRGAAPDDRRNTALLLAGAFVIGLSMSFKQSGLFSVLGLVAALTAMLGRSAGDRRFARLLFWGGVVLPLVAFLALRVPSVAGKVPTNLVSLLPWVAALVVFARVPAAAEPEGAQPEVGWRAACAALAAAAAGALVWLALYSPSDWWGVWKEMYLVMPGLIDRDLPAVSGSWPHRLVVMAGAAWLWLRASRFSSASGEPAGRAERALAVATVAGFLLVVLPIPGLGRRATPRATLLRLLPWWNDGYTLVPLLTVWGTAWLALRRESMRAPERALLLLALVASGSAFPYPGNTMYTGFLRSVGLIPALMLLHRAQPFAAQGPRGWVWYCRGATAALVAAVAAMAGLNARVQMGVERSDAGIASARISEPERPFSETARWLAEHSTARETVWGYPNFALTLAFAERFANGWQPNFLGRPEEFEALCGVVERGEGPDLFVCSPTNYPYPPNHPYHPDPARLIRALEAGYSQVAEFAVAESPGWRAGEIRVYRRR